MAEIDPFATIQELRARWPDMPVGSDDHADVLLGDATQFILDTCPLAERASVSTKRRVVCAIVRRALQSDSAELAGFETTQFTSGPYSFGGRVSNPYGDFYLTRQEKKALGCGRQVAFGVQAFRSGYSIHAYWCDRAFRGDTCSCGAALAGEPTEGVAGEPQP